MLTKRKEPRSFVSTDSGNIGPIEEGYKYFPQIQIQKKPKSSHSILSIMIFLLPFLLANKVDSNEFSFFDNRANSPKITVFFLFLYRATLNLFFVYYNII